MHTPPNAISAPPKAQPPPPSTLHLRKAQRAARDWYLALGLLFSLGLLVAAQPPVSTGQRVGDA
eukprot:283672-Rhodomonas_salina.2